MAAGWRSELPRGLVLVLFASVLACSGSAAHIEDGTLVGRLERYPSMPVESGTAGPVPAMAGVKLAILVRPGRQVATVVTDKAGRFSLSLPPGEYEVVLASCSRKLFSKDLPAAVVVNAGRATHISVRIDSGLR